jgi:outer membrane protein OmpA-like peptidoglycan-associated protein
MRVWQKLATAGLLAVTGCAPVIPKELVNARSAYIAMDRGGANSSDTQQTQTAREALSRAEDSYRDHGASRETRDLALEAERQAVSAQVACVRNSGEGTVAVIETGTMTPAQRRLKEVLTAVPGTVMFEFDKSDLLPAAKMRLDQLAKALDEVRRTEEPQPITIEGYADAKGDPAYNKELSERRANAVRDYLTSRGYDANLVQVRANGESHPFTTNATAEGRANNRRVEIILGPKKSEE